MPVLVAAGVAMALAGCAPATAGPGAPEPSVEVVATASPAPSIRIYQESHFKGSGTMSKTTDRLHAIVARNPTVFSGDWFSPSDPGIFVVGVALPHDPAAVELETLRKSLDPSSKTTRTVPAKYSLAKLLQVQHEIMEQYMPPAGDVRGLGPDPINEAVLVDILQTDKDPVLTGNATVRALAAKYGSLVEFQATTGVSAVD